MAKIGIDFGTTITKVAYIDGNGEARTIDFDGSVRIPTVLFYRHGKDKPELVGQRAYNMYQSAKNHPELCSWIAKDLKRNLNSYGRPTPNPQLRYIDAVCDLFKYIKGYVESRVFDGKETVDEVCITYPANPSFGETYKQLLRQAAQDAGFTRVILLKEPFAAAMGYINYLAKEANRTNAEESVLVYDFGGGTIDVSYVEIKRDGMFCPFDPCGDSNCGGEDIDRDIYNAWDKLMLKETGKHISQEEGMLNIPFLRTDCKENKEVLSEHFRGNERSIYTLSNFVEGELLEMNVSYEQWRSFIDPTIQTTIKVVEELMAVVRNADKRIDTILLIGGSSDLEQVKLELEKEYGLKPITMNRKDVAVANGAALFIEKGVVPVKCYCINCGKELNTTMKYCPYCTPKTQEEDKNGGWSDDYLMEGHVKNYFYDKRCEEIEDN